MRNEVVIFTAEYTHQLFARLRNRAIRKYVRHLQLYLNNKYNPPGSLPSARDKPKGKVLIPSEIFIHWHMYGCVLTVNSTLCHILYEVSIQMYTKSAFTWIFTLSIQSQSMEVSAQTICLPQEVDTIIKQKQSHTIHNYSGKS